MTQEEAGASPVGPPQRSDPVAQPVERQRDELEAVGSSPTWISSSPPRSSSSVGRAPASQAGGRGIVPHLDHDARGSPLGGPAGADAGARSAPLSRRDTRIDHRDVRSLDVSKKSRVRAPGGGLGRMPAKSTWGLGERRARAGCRASRDTRRVPRQRGSLRSSRRPFVPVLERASSAATRRTEGATPSRHFLPSKLNGWST